MPPPRRPLFPWIPATDEAAVRENYQRALQGLVSTATLVFHSDSETMHKQSVRLLVDAATTFGAAQEAMINRNMPIFASPGFLAGLPGGGGSDTGNDEGGNTTG